MPRIIERRGAERSLGRSDKPHPKRIEPVITFNVCPLDASPTMLLGNIVLAHSNGSEASAAAVERVNRISVTSNMYVPIDNRPSGERTPGFWYNDNNKANNETNRINRTRETNNRRVNLNSFSAESDNEKIENVDMTTAVSTRGIAGKEIS